MDCWPKFLPRFRLSSRSTQNMATTRPTLPLAWPRPQRQRVGDWHVTWDWRKAAARLAWVASIRQVLEVALSLLGVSAPPEMKRADVAEDVAASAES
jgi:hypothetical protein